MKLKTILIAALLITLTVSQTQHIQQDDGSADCLDALKERLRTLMEQNTLLKQANDDLSSTTITLNETKELITSQLESCSENLESLQNDKATLESELADLYVQIVELNRELTNLQETVTSLEYEISSCEDNNTTLLDANAALTDGNSELEADIASLTIEYNDLLIALAECENDLYDNNATIEFLQTYITELIAENEAFNSQLIDNINSAISSLQAIVDTRSQYLADLIAEIETMRNTITTLTYTLSVQDQTILDLQVELINCQGCGPLMKTFVLTLQYACRTDTALNSCQGDVLWNGINVGSLIPEDYEIHSFTVNVNAIPGTNMLQLQGAGISDSLGLTVDDVSLVRYGSTENVVVNGGFELPNTGNSFIISDNILGWSGQQIEIGKGTIYNSRWTSQVLELDSFVNFPITQSFLFDQNLRIITPLSNKFTLSFEYACRRTIPFASCQGNFYWNDQVVFSMTPSDYNIHTMSVVVYAQVGVNTLKIEGTGTSDSLGLTIDNVSLIREGSTDNIVINGDFENPTAGGSFVIRSDIIGWTGNQIEIGRGSIYNTLWTSQVLELDSNSNSVLTQEFTFDEYYHQDIETEQASTCPETFAGNPTLIAIRDAKLIQFEILMENIQGLISYIQEKNEEVSHLQSDIDYINSLIYSCNLNGTLLGNSIDNMEYEISCLDDKIISLRQMFNTLADSLNICSK